MKPNILSRSILFFFLQLGVQEISSQICQNLPPDQITPDITNFRLPKTILPEIYEIDLLPNMTTIDASEFYGQTAILANVEENTDKIIFHSLELEFLSLEVFLDGLKIDVDCYVYALNDFIVLKRHFTTADFQKGQQIIIKISYKGSLINKTYGFYKSYYNKPDGQKVEIIASHGEPTYSRRSFPNFDEPDFKAEHRISISYDKSRGFFAISNMPVEGYSGIEDLSQDLEIHNWQNYERAIFQTTPKMSTYLATFIVCDFDYVQDTSQSGIPLRVYLTKHQNNLKQGDWALKNLKHSFNYFEQDLFKIPYPLPKMDMIAIPNFNTGAMENWGAVTYRETALLAQEGVSSDGNFLRVSQVIAHELAHMWFGDLVTMSWWDHLWLNEGFATFFQHLGIDASISRIFNRTEANKWQQINSIIDRNFISALNYDDAIIGNPIIYSAKTKNTITQVFNTIPYRKGAAFIWSMVEIMGFDEFFGGVTDYLRENSYGNVDSGHLLRALERKMDAKNVKNFRKFYNDYLQNQGYPLISIDDNGIVQQKQFFEMSSMLDQVGHLDRRSWCVPVWVENRENWVGCDTNPRQPTELHPIPTLDQIISKNYRIIARYKYSPSRNEKIISNLLTNSSTYTMLERKQYLDDLFALTFSHDYDSYIYVRQAIEYLKNEKEVFVWNRFLAGVFRIIGGLDDSPGSDKIAEMGKIIFPITENISKNLDIYNDQTSSTLDFQQKSLKSKLVLLHIKLRQKEAEEYILKYFRNWVENDIEVPPNMKSLVYTNGMKFFSEATNMTEDEYSVTKVWDKILIKMGTSTLASEKMKLITCLANVDNENLLNELLDLAFTGKVPARIFIKNPQKTIEIKQQDTLTTLYYVSKYSKTGQKVAQNYLAKNFEKNMVQKFGLFHRKTARIIAYIFSRYNNESDFKFAEKFWFERVEGLDLAAKNEVEKSLHKIKINMAMVESVEGFFGDF